MSLYTHTEQQNIDRCLPDIKRYCGLRELDFHELMNKSYGLFTPKEFLNAFTQAPEFFGGPSEIGVFGIYKDYSDIQDYVFTLQDAVYQNRILSSQDSAVEVLNYSQAYITAYKWVDKSGLTQVKKNTQSDLLFQQPDFHLYALQYILPSCMRAMRDRNYLQIIFIPPDFMSFSKENVTGDEVKIVLEQLNSFISTANNQIENPGIVFLYGYPSELFS